MLSTIIDVMVHVSLLICVGMVLIIARRYQKSPLKRAFLAVLGITTLWNMGTLLELDARLITGMTYMPLVYISYIGICLMPIGLLHLGKVMSAPEWQPKRIHVIFLIVPVVSIIMVVTNPIHKLFYVNFSLYSADAVYGIYFWFHTIYSYSCIAAGIIMMLVASVRNTRLFSMQTLLVVAGILLALVPNVLFSFGVANLPFSVSVAAFTLTFLCFAIAFMKYRFIASLPISLRQVVDLISDGYLVIDRQQGILAFNRALTLMFPDLRDTALGSDLKVFVKQQFKDVSYEQFLELQAQAVLMQETVSIEANLVKGLYVSVEITPVMQRSAHIGFIILLKDITQSKLLIEATKAESRYKSKFLSNMSHEMRTPMNAIIGMVNIGKTTDDIERKNYCMMRIDNASKHLLGVINDVLDISKIEAGKFELSPIMFDFGKTLQRVFDVVKFRADEKEQALTVHLDDNIPRILYGDDIRISQVVTNLLGNAVKFTPSQGSITLRAYLLEEESGVCTIQFEVTDTGIGISLEQQHRLFQSYVQAKSDTTRKFGGTGLGLSISKKIVELMGGTIWVKSELGHGSTFAFTVKLVRGEDKENELSGPVTADFSGASGTAAEKLHGDHSGAYEGYCVLLAEDVEINREIVTTLLEPTLLEIDCAENGAQAVSMFKESPDKYAVIFMDVQMPEMDGYEATRAIRALPIPHAKVVPIIAMTANVFREDIEKCLDAGMNGHIGKPLNIDDVHEQLERYLFRQLSIAERRKGDRRVTSDRRQTPERRKGDRRKQTNMP